MANHPDLRGRFWLPGDDHCVSVGHLGTRDGYRYLSLEGALFPSLGRPLEAGDVVPVLHGELESRYPDVRGILDDRFVTLLDAPVVRSALGVGLEPGDSHPTRLAVNRLIVGAHVEEEITARERVVSVDLLSQWFDDSGISWADPLHERDGLQRTLEFREPPHIEVELDGSRLSIGVSFAAPRRHPAENPTVFESVATARFCHGRAVPESKFAREYAGPLCQFVSFAVGPKATISGTRVRLAADEAAAAGYVQSHPMGHGATVLVWLTWGAVPRARPTKDVHPVRQVLPRKEIAGREGDVLGAWWHLSSAAGFSLSALVDAICSGSVYAEERVLALTSRLEAYARAVHMGGWEASDDLENDVNAILADCSALRNSGRIEGVLKSMLRRPSYSECLTVLLERLEHLPGRLLGWSRADLRATMAARDYLAHGGGPRPPGVLAAPERMVRLSDRLRAIAIGSVILDLGLSLEDVEAAWRRTFSGYAWFNGVSV